MDLHRLGEFGDSPVIKVGGTLGEVLGKGGRCQER
jgi:hypothetical protein